MAESHVEVSSYSSDNSLTSIERWIKKEKKYQDKESKIK